MTSKAFAQGTFHLPEASPENTASDEKSLNYRHPTVYDAVAGTSLPTLQQTPIDTLQVGSPSQDSFPSIW